MCLLDGRSGSTRVPFQGSDASKLGRIIEKDEGPFDARSKGQPWPFPSSEVMRIGGISLGLLARPGRSIAKQLEGGAGEKHLPAGGRVIKTRAMGDY